MILSEKASAFFIENLISKTSDKKNKLGSSNIIGYAKEPCDKLDESNQDLNNLSSFFSTSSSSPSSLNSPYLLSHFKGAQNSHDCVSPVSSK